MGKTPTHCGKDWRGRRTLLLWDPLSLRFYNRTDYRALYAGATREWPDYSDVNIVSPCTIPGCEGSIDAQAKCLSGCRSLGPRDNTEVSS